MQPTETTGIPDDVTGLQSQFTVTIKGPLHWLLGFEVQQYGPGTSNTTSGKSKIYCIKLKQQLYIDQLLERFNMGNLNSCLISWRSTKQHAVATSTTEAEYMALSATARQASWYVNGIKELDVRVPIVLKCNNTSTIDLSHHTIISQRSKHIDIHYHYIRECLLNSKFTLEYIKTSDNLADIFTKALDAVKHKEFTQLLGCTS